MKDNEKAKAKLDIYPYDKIAIDEEAKLDISAYLGEPRSYSEAIDFLSLHSEKLKTVKDQLSDWGCLAETPNISIELSDFQKDDFSLNTIHSYLPKIDDLESISSMINTSREATLAYSSLTSPSIIPTLTQSIKGDFKSWYETNILNSALHTPTVDSILGLTDIRDVKASHILPEKLSELSLQTGFIKATELSLFTEKALLGVTEGNLGSRIGLTPDVKDYLKFSLNDLSESYSTLLKSFDNNPLSYTQINPLVSKTPPIECFLTADLLGVISVDQEITLKEEKLKKEIQLENEISLKSHLSKLNSDLYNMWEGAIQSFNSNNKDRIRHFSTSIRELITHVLHILAPDDALKKWSTDKSHYSNGKPTRRARLLFICRNINHKPLNEFVEKNVGLTISLMDIFHRGTHKVFQDFSDYELIAIKSKAEGVLKFLLEIHFATNI